MITLHPEVQVATRLLQVAYKAAKVVPREAARKITSPRLLFEIENPIGVKPMSCLFSRSPNGAEALRCLPGDGTAIYALPGTNERQDWLTNFDFRRVRVPAAFGLPAGRLRRGHAGAGRWTWEKLMKRDVEGGLFLRIYGHSYGAAQAVAAAVYGGNHLSQFRSLLTFGGPRVCSPATARELTRALGDRGERYSTGIDVVPGLVPPLWLAHALHPRWISGKGPPVVLNRAKWKKIPELGFALTHRGLQVREDHSMASYQKRIDLALSEGVAELRGGAS